MAGRNDTDEAATDEPISPDDLRAKLKELSGEADDVATEYRGKVIAAGTAVAVVLIILIFLIGRSRGKKATTVVEIVRV